MLTKTARSLVDYLDDINLNLKDVPSKEKVVDLFKKNYGVNVDEHEFEEGQLNNLYHVRAHGKPTLVNFTNMMRNIISKNKPNANTKKQIKLFSDMQEAASKDMSKDSIFIDKKYENSVPLIAHEYGHAANLKNKFLAVNRKFKDAPLSFLAPFYAGYLMHMVGEGTKHNGLRAAGVAVRAAASVPELVDEYYASKNARKVLREAGLKDRPYSLDAALGTYLVKNLGTQAAAHYLNKAMFR